MDGREVENRAISVKVAIDKPKEEKENGDNSTADVDANGSSWTVFQNRGLKPQMKVTGQSGVFSFLLSLYSSIIQNCLV